MDQSNSEELSLYFEPPAVTAPNLQHQIQQLIQERGALRFITKQTLQVEIDRPKAVGEDLDDNDEEARSEDEPEMPQARQETLWKAREEMLQKLAYAQNEILSALDFVSLLLSGSSIAAQSSMSPALKQHVPSGTLEGHAVERWNVTQDSRHRLNQVSEGWKSESFQTASNKFAQAAGRLQREAQRQSKYWDQIASLKTQGWFISRLPSDSRAVGVHYGFPEATPQFRNRGFALLHQDESGNLQLDSRSVSDTQTRIRVTVMRKGIETGTSQLQMPDGQHENGIIEQIRIARDALFEEELFYEISREARLVANHGTRTRPNAVEADIDTQTQIRIVQTILDESQDGHTGGPDDRLAESIVLNLRLLLISEHEKSKQRREKPPATMSLTPRATPEYAILRPVLANLRHQASLTVLADVSKTFTRTLAKASIHVTYNIKAATEREKPQSMHHLRMPAQSLLLIQVEAGRSIEIEVETYLGSPIHGTVYRSRKIDFDFVQLQASSFNTFNEALEYLTRAFTLELISQTQDFTVVRPRSGEVALKGSGKATAVVAVRPQRLSLLVTDAGKTTTFSWRPSGYQRIPDDGSSIARSFVEIVTALR